MSELGSVGIRSRHVAGFRQDRNRARNRIFLLLGGVVIFTACLAQVWLTTEVADRNCRVNRLEREVGMTAVGIEISQAQLSRRQIFGELHGAAEVVGLARGGPREEIALEFETLPDDGVLEQIAADIQRGSWLLLTEAVAQDRPTEMRSGSSR